MITIDGIPIQQGDRYKLSLKGNSSDEKPTKEYNGMPIGNGSTFLTMDSASVNFYDQANEKWV